MRFFTKNTTRMEEDPVENENWRGYCEVTFVLCSLIFLIGRSFYTGCNQEEIKNLKQKSKTLINEGIRRATFAELPDLFQDKSGKESRFIRQVLILYD